MKVSRRGLLSAAAPLLIPGATFQGITAAADQGGQGALSTLRGPKFFIIAAYAQDPGSMSAWKARGINTMISPTDDFAGGNGPLWRKTCHDLGLKMIVGGRHEAEGGRYYPPRASNSYALNQSDPLVIGNHLADEPDQTPPLKAEHEAEIAFARSLGNTKPFHVAYTNNVTGMTYVGLGPQQWVNWAAPDWLGADNYAYQIGYTYKYAALYADEGYVGPFTTMSGHGVSVLVRGPLNKVPITHPNRAMIAYLATGRITDGAPGGQPWPRMTALQFLLQAWSCIINGAAGLAMFAHYNAGSPHQIGDDTNAELAGALATLAAQIAILESQPLGNVLMDTALGGRRAYIWRPCTDSVGGGGFKWPTDQPNFGSTSGLQLPPWFEGFEVALGGETFCVALNLHDSQPKTLTDTRMNKSRDVFAPGQCKFWKRSAPSENLFAPLRPTALQRLGRHPTGGADATGDQVIG
jgi:hypothetical protein